MLHLGYDWDLDSSGVILDKEINIQRLGWAPGNYFKLVQCNDGSFRLKKVEEIEEFLIKGSSNG